MIKQAWLRYSSTTLEKCSSCFFSKINSPWILLTIAVDALMAVSPSRAGSRAAAVKVVGRGGIFT